MQHNNLSGAIPASLSELIRMSKSPRKRRFSTTFFVYYWKTDHFISFQNPFSSPTIYTDMIRLDKNNLIGAVPEEICNVYAETLPVFFSDCTSEVVCSCCLFCCADTSDECTCQFENTDLDFLCFQRSINIFGWDGIV